MSFRYVLYWVYVFFIKWEKLLSGRKEKRWHLIGQKEVFLYLEVFTTTLLCRTENNKMKFHIFSPFFIFRGQKKTRTVGIRIEMSFVPRWRQDRCSAGCWERRIQSLGTARTCKSFKFHVIYGNVLRKQYFKCLGLKKLRREVFDLSKMSFNVLRENGNFYVCSLENKIKTPLNSLYFSARKWKFPPE